MLDKHNLIVLSMQQLSKKVNSTNESSGVPSSFSSSSCDNFSYESLMSPKWKKMKLIKSMPNEMITFSKSLCSHGNSLEAVEKIEAAQNVKIKICKEWSELRNIIESLHKERREMTNKYETTSDEVIKIIFSENKFKKLKYLYKTINPV